MANFKRKRPHKHPRSVMSSPDRVFESRDTGVAEIAEQLDEFEDNGAPPAQRQKKKRRKRYEIEFRTFRVSTEFLKHLQRHEPTQKFYDALLLSESLDAPCRIFKNLQREGVEEGCCYASLPSRRFRSHDFSLSPPPGKIFLVFVSRDFIVMDWEWREVAQEYETYPKDWETDFGEDLWP